MTIQFKCSECSTVLSVDDTAAGKSARCPNCQSIQPVPTDSTSAPPTGMPPEQPANPFAQSQPNPAQPNPAGSPASGLANPYASPSEVGTPLSPSIGGFQPTHAEFGDIFSHAWSIFKQNIGLLVGATLVVFGISFGFSFISSIFSTMAQRNDAPQMNLISSLIGLMGNAVNMFVGIGMAQISLALARRQPANVGMLFGGGNRFLPVLGSSILFGIGMVIGLLLLVIPGLIFALLVWPYYYFVVDGQASVSESFSRAFAVGKLNWSTSLVLGIMAMVIMFAGALALGIGLLFAAPLVGLMFSTAYLMMKGERLPA